MLKPADPRPPVDERPVGELVHELIEEGKAYAQAEIGLAKAIAAAKGKALALPVALLARRFICLLAAVTALAVGVVMALGPFIGPLAGGFVGHADLRRNCRGCSAGTATTSEAGIMIDGSTADEIVAARVEVDRSRARLMATAHELQERLSPRCLLERRLGRRQGQGRGPGRGAVDAVRVAPARDRRNCRGTDHVSGARAVDRPRRDDRGRVKKRKSRKSRKARTKNRKTRRQRNARAGNVTPDRRREPRRGNARSKLTRAPANALWTRLARRRYSRLPAALPLER